MMNANSNTNTLICVKTRDFASNCVEIFMFSPPTESPPEKNYRVQGLGAFSVLSDDEIFEMMKRLEMQDYLVLSSASKIFRILLMSEDIWRRMFLSQNPSKIEFKGTWRQTLEHFRTVNITAFNMEFPYFSPFLQRRNYLCFINLFGSNPPVARDKMVAIVDQSTMNFELLLLFENLSEPLMVPFGPETNWITNSAWSLQTLQTYCSDTKLWIGNSENELKFIKMSVSEYCMYLNLQHDEKPLYLFDKDFGKYLGFLLKAYEIPSYIQDDYQSILGNDRPAFRWIIYGPMRSGASWHTDPAGTSAWNTLVQGRKLWALYPPNRHPPGLKEDQSSLEWFSFVYPNLSPFEKPLEIIQNAGDTIVVPAGWWHCVLNLDSINIAVTQNFTSRINFKEYLLDLQKYKPKIFKKVLERFTVIPEASEIIDEFKNPKPKMTIEELIPFVKKVLCELEISCVDWNLNNFELLDPHKVVYCVPLNLYIKFFFKKQSHFNNEVTAINALATTLENIVPITLGSGTITVETRTMDFIVTRGCLLPPDNYPISMYMLPREHLSIINMNGVLLWSVHVLKIIHSQIIETTSNLDFISEMQQLSKSAVDRHLKFGFLPRNLIDLIPKYLENFELPFSTLQRGILHGDFTNGNLLGHYHSKDDNQMEFMVSNLIDFGDAMIGYIDPLYDIATLFVTVFRCDARLLKDFLKLYFDTTELDWPSIKYRILVYIFLYPSGCVTREMAKELTLNQRIFEIKSMKHLEDILFSTKSQ